MKKIALTTLFLALVAGLAWGEQLTQNPPPKRPSSATPSPKPAVPSQQRTPAPPPPLSTEKAFYYFLAIYGAPDNVIERYGNYFDPVNYRRAMADEFERGRYTESIRARIADGVRTLDFADKFTLVGSTAFEGYTTLGEYSFASHSFPLANLPYNSFCLNMDHSSGICGGTLMDVTNARVRDAVNGMDFTWSVPMSEAEASAFVKSRSVGGSVNRRVAARITYSITNKTGKVDYAGRGGTFSPYIYSVEIFTDESLTKRLAVITPQPGTPISAFMPETALAAQSATKVIATYHYTASCRENYKCVTPIVGAITLTDGGITLSGEQRDGSAKPSKSSFFSAFAGGETKLWRANFTNGTWGGSDFRVVWRPFWQQDYKSALVFADRQERDRFFVDLTVALQKWAAKYSQFAFAKLSIDQRCEVNTYLVTCSESSPFEVNPRSPEPTATASGGAVPVAGSAPAANARSLETPSAAVEGGEQVVVSIKYNSAIPGYLYLATGRVTVSKAAVAFDFTYGLDDFTVSPEKILDVVSEPQQNSRIHIKVAVKNKKGDKESTKEFYFYSPGAVAVGTGPGGAGGSISCNACDDSMSVLYALLQRARGKS